MGPRRAILQTYPGAMAARVFGFKGPILVPGRAQFLAKRDPGTFGSAMD
jgi:hypothetical protein